MPIPYFSSLITDTIGGSQAHHSVCNIKYNGLFSDEMGIKILPQYTISCGLPSREQDKRTF